MCKMTIGIFTTITNPIERGDLYHEALKCYKQLADTVTVIDGKNSWPPEFRWELIGKHFQQGYEETHADWVIHCDLDFIFHEADYQRIRQALRDYPNAPAVSFYKWQFILPDRYNLKSRLPLAVNKKVYGDRIKFNGGGDLCQPTLDGRELDLNELPQAGVPFYCYEKILKTKAQIIEDVERMDRAYERTFHKPLYSSEDQSAYEGWLRMVCGRFKKPQRIISLHQHPKVMQNTILALRPDQWGFNGLGHLPVNEYMGVTNA